MADVSFKPVPGIPRLRDMKKDEDRRRRERKEKDKHQAQDDRPPPAPKGRIDIKA
ncbi:MAG: hypothetical protein HZA20_12600 [Nitrospirae bacterium]|nr:hypothetical protein [Nitrospirota bacterium]